MLRQICSTPGRSFVYVYCVPLRARGNNSSAGYPRRPGINRTSSPPLSAFGPFAALIDGGYDCRPRLRDQIFSQGEAIGKSRWLGISMGHWSSYINSWSTRHKLKPAGCLTAIEEAVELKRQKVTTQPVYISSCMILRTPRKTTRRKVADVLRPSCENGLASVKKRLENPQACLEALKRGSSSRTELAFQNHDHFDVGDEWLLTPRRKMA